MDIIKAIENRKSIRKFLNKEVDKEIITKIIKAGMNAPSPKNKQPWKFVVVRKSSKEELLAIMNKGTEKLKSDYGLVIDIDNLLASYNESLKVIKQAPVIIIVINTENRMMERRNPLKRLMELANIQSAGAAVENMLLASLEYGIGGLWMTDIYFTIDEISEWLNTKRQILAAIALGYPAEDPVPKKKKKPDELVEWR